MREWIMNQGLVMYIFAGILVIGLISSFVANRGYKKLIKEADLMGTSNNRLIKYIKLKFESYYKLGMQPQSSEALTKHYISKYKLGFMSIGRWEKLGKLAMLATAVTILVRGLMMLQAGIAMNDIAAMSGIGVISLLLLYGQNKLYDFTDKKSTLYYVILDYLENFMKNKLGPGKDLTKNRREMDGKGMKEAAATSVRPSHKRGHASLLDDDAAESSDEVDAKIVEDILKEFLN